MSGGAASLQVELISAALDFLWIRAVFVVRGFFVFIFAVLHMRPFNFSCFLVSELFDHRFIKPISLPAVILASHIDRAAQIEIPGLPAAGRCLRLFLGAHEVKAATYQIRALLNLLFHQIHRKDLLRLIDGFQGATRNENSSAVYPAPAVSDQVA